MRLQFRQWSHRPPGGVSMAPMYMLAFVRAGGDARQPRASTFIDIPYLGRRVIDARGATR
jgi:hypothetical protein